MLYKNDDGPIRLSKADVASIEKHFHGKFPVKVVYPSERIVKSRLKHNVLPDKPNSISFDLKGTVKTNDGVEVWRYAEQVVADDLGRKQYLPKKFRYNGARYLERTDIELIYFLLRKSSFCQGGDNEGKRVKFVFEDLVSEAEKKAEKRETDNKLATLLYNKETGLSEERLRLVAKAYFVRGVDDLTISQVRIILDGKVHKSKDGPEKFFDMVNADEELKARESIQKAVDMGLIVSGPKEWAWKTPEGKTEHICNIPPTRSAHDVLYDIYKGDEGFRKDLMAALLAKNPKAGKGGQDTNIDE